MYAVIETGGKQYRVTPGQTIEVETLNGEVGSDVEFDRVLAISSDSNELVVGEALKTARVRGKIAAHGRGDTPRHPYPGRGMVTPLFGRF